MVFTTEELFEVAIESWPEWDLNQLSYQAMSSTHTLFYIYIHTDEFILQICSVLISFILILLIIDFFTCIFLNVFFDILFIQIKSFLLTFRYF